MPKLNYQQIEEDLEVALGEDRISSWRELTKGQYRLSERLDIFPRSQKYFFIEEHEWGNYDILDNLINDFL